MNFYKKILYSFIFNLSIFSFLIIGIQNSNQKSKVNLIINQTVDLPISFIIGVSFITGSFISTFITIKKSPNE